MVFARTAMLALLVALAAGLSASAETAPDTASLAASEALRAAATDLAAAVSPAERVAALTATLRAYEEGLEGLRDALRRASLREAEITGRLAADRLRIARLLSALAAAGGRGGADGGGGPALILHPDGPESTIRAGMLMGAALPALEAEAAALAATLVDVALIRRLQNEAAGTLAAGHQAAQEARQALARAVADRRDLPMRFLEDPEELRALVANADTLEAFALGMATMETDIGAPVEDFAGAEGRLPLPALGRLIRRAGEADAAGIVRPGIVLQTAPLALVTAPWPATIRYRGPLLDYENVMVIEPARGYLLILAGLGAVYGQTGDVVAEGAPLGLMGGEPRIATATDEEAGGVSPAETLYIELRLGKKPVDPAIWFAATRPEQE